MTNRINEILAFELKNGCINKAVNGGLDAYLSKLTINQSPSSTIIKVIAILPMEGYRSLSIENRSQWIQTALNLMQTADKFNQKNQNKKQVPRVINIKNSTKTITDPKKILQLSIKQSNLGIRANTITSLEKLGVMSVHDALMFFPYRYTDFSQIVPIATLESGKYQTIKGKIIRSKIIRMGRGGKLRATEIIIKDEKNSSMRILWFNQVFIANYLKIGYQVALSGKVKFYKGQPTFDNAEYEIIDKNNYAGKIIPTYHLTKGIAQKTIRNFTKKIIETYSLNVQDTLPEIIRKKYAYPSLSEAIQHIHSPATMEEMYVAQKRIAFEELLGIQISIMQKKQAASQLISAVQIIDTSIVNNFITTLPFELTNAQQKAITTIINDLQSNTPMSRLLEGDVGSGKTVIALCAILAIVTQKGQAVLMAPTEILAEQHFKTIIKLLTGKTELSLFRLANIPGFIDPIRIVLLTGSMSAKEKKYNLELINNGTASIVIGTHALIQAGVQFKKLGLIVIDEQHRFGVMQRAELKNKSSEKEIEPHTLVMTATPIPRTLALTAYGDLDLTIIDELPKGRKTIQTKLLKQPDTSKAFDRIFSEINNGNQAFVICPLVEESEFIDRKAVITEHKRLQNNIFPDIKEKIGLLHGKMKSKEKEKIMEKFEEKELSILVATSVIEVGIDIPDATVIVIEGADRFGLAQLHQLRGRVGRSDKDSYCFLIADNANEESELRLKTFESINDGFELAEADLQLRGPGEVYGTKQSGLPSIRVAALLDARLIDRARQEASTILNGKYDFSELDKKKITELTNVFSNKIIHEIH